jgi:multidrug efflux system membrane fusion protein
MKIDPITRVPRFPGSRVPFPLFRGARSSPMSERTVAVLSRFLLVLGVGCGTRVASGPPRVPVSVAQAVRRAVPYQVQATGTVETVRRVNVTSQVTGLLQRVRFAEGDEVTAGQVLFQIDPRPYQAALLQAEANLGRDAAQAANALRDAARYRSLAAERSVTEEDYQQRQTAAEALTATVQADSAALSLARLNLEYATIRAPISGRSGSLLVHEGNVVVASASTPLVTINQIRPILVQFAVPAAELPALQRRPQASLRVLAQPAQDTTPLEGAVSFIDNHIDSATGTLMLKARFPNHDGLLWPGEFVNVTLVLGEQADALVIPAQAVVAAQQGTYVFVVNPDGTAEQRPVTVERTLDTLAVIADGLAPGAVVVTDGQLRLTPDARVEIRASANGSREPESAP